MRKSNFLLFNVFVFILLFPALCFSQSKEANIWYFGENAGIDFNSGAPVVLDDGELNTREGVATICDAEGSLLFYTEGTTIWDRQHNKMPNGQNLRGHYSSSQSAVIFPIPGSSTLYYVFTVGVGNESSINYNIVDMTRNSGLGDVTVKNKSILSNTAEKLIAVKQANGEDYWVIGYKSSKIYVFSVTNQGVGTAKTFSLGTNYTKTGYLKVSSDGRYIACAFYESQIITLLNFNNETGQISGPIITINNVSNPYGLEFSPNNSILYVGGVNSPNVSNDKGGVYQYDISSGNQTTIRNSKVTLIQHNTHGFGALQLGPDSRIYVSRETGYINSKYIPYDYLGVIKKPNIAGSGCGFVENAVNLSPGKIFIGLPTFMASFLYKPEFTIENTCLGNTTTFTIQNNTDIQSVSWDFGDGTTSTDFNPMHQYQVAGKYIVTLTANYLIGTSTSSREFELGPLPNVNLGQDATLCQGETLLLDAGAGFASYSWFENAAGQTTQQVTADQEGLYWVQVENQQGCVGYDSIWVSYYPQTQVQISPNPAQICEGEQITLNASSGFADYKWQDGSTNSWFSTNIEHYVSVEAHDVNGCYSWDSLTVEVLPGINVDLGPDTLLCGDERYLIDAGYGQDYTYQWHGNSSETSRTIITQKDGLYWVDVTNSSGCTGADSVYISHVPYPEFDLGSDTTICMQDTIEIGVEAETMSTYSWLPADSVDFPYLSKNLISPDDTTTYFLEVTRNWCTSVDSITINSIDCSCPYAFDNMVVNCNDLHDCDCDVPRICVPLKTVHPINDGIIGLDFCVEYDTRYLSPTGKVNIGEVVTNNGTYPEGIQCDYYVNYILDPGKVHVSIYYQSPAPESAAFQYIENGTVACVEFLLKSDFNKDSTLEFTSCELRESYQLGVIDQCVEPGSFKLIDDTILEGNLIFWDDITRPLRYDAANPANYRRTDISACGDSMVVSNPDLNGYFEYDITNGIDLEILRDIPGSYFEPCDDTSGDGECDVADKVNGFDCYRTGLVTTMNSSFFPSIYEILAMDVNQSGSVEAGDITQIQNRFLKETFEFPQVWNYSDDPQNPVSKSRDWVFVDELLLAQPEYKASAMYPLKGDEYEAGYSKYQLPVVPFCLPVDTIQKQFCTITPEMTYHAILLGDVNGDWESDYSTGEPVSLKSGSKESIVFDLENATKNNNILSIPVKYTGKDNLMSLDFIMESYDNSKLELIEIESNYQQEMQMAYNDNIRLISFSKVFGGISANQPVYNVKFKSFSNEISAEDLGNVISYVNGIKLNTIITGAVPNENTTIGVKNPQVEQFVVVAPNPCKGNFKVSTNIEGAYDLKIINILGKIIYKQELTAPENYINISSEPDGMYYIILIQNNKTIIEKLLID